MNIYGSEENQGIGEIFDVESFRLPSKCNVFLVFMQMLMIVFDQSLSQKYKNVETFLYLFEEV